MSSAAPRDTDFDRAAAVTRSLLGWGVLAGPIYLLVGVVLALTRDGFDLTEHALSLLMLGDRGWMQAANLVLSGVLVLVAAYGFARAMAGSGAGRWTAILLGVFGVGLIGSGLFPPDPVAGFPPGSEPGDASASGILHLAFGALQFLALVVATQTAARWILQRGDSSWAGASRAAGVVVLLGFVGGAAFATTSVGVLLLWIAVVAGYAWISATSVYLYRTVPHPDLHRRAPATA